jgi:hypothetical protein
LQTIRNEELLFSNIITKQEEVACIPEVFKFEFGPGLWSFWEISWYYTVPAKKSLQYYLI